MKKKVLVLIALLACVSVVNAATCLSIVDGKWIDGTTWDTGHAPGGGDAAHVINHMVTIDSAINLGIGNAPSGNLQIGGWGATGDSTLRIVQGGSLAYHQGVYMGMSTNTNRLNLNNGSFSSGFGFAFFHGSGENIVRLTNGGNFSIGALQVTSATGLNLIDVQNGTYTNTTTGATKTPVGATINLGGDGVVRLSGTVNADNVLTTAGLGTLAQVNGVAAQASDFVFDYSQSGWTAITVIPEPATMFLLGIGSLVLVRRRRN